MMKRRTDCELSGVNETLLDEKGCGLQGVTADFLERRLPCDAHTVSVSRIDRYSAT